MINPQPPNPSSISEHLAPQIPSPSGREATVPQESVAALLSQQAEQEHQPPTQPASQQQPLPSHGEASNPQGVGIPPQLLAQLLTAQRRVFPFQNSPVFMGPPVQMIGMPQQSQTSVRIWSGQFPSPEAVEHYEKVLPGSFDRIIKMTEQLQEAQITEAREIRQLTSGDARHAKNLGAVVTTLAMIGALFCTYIGASWVAGCFLSVPVMAVAQSLVESAKREKPSDIAKAVVQATHPSENSKP